MNDAKYVSLWEVYLYHGTKKHFSNWALPILLEAQEQFDKMDKIYVTRDRINTGGRFRVDYIITEKCAAAIKKNHRKIKIEPWMYRNKETMDEYLSSLTFRDVLKQVGAPEEFLVEVINEVYYDKMEKSHTTVKTFPYPQTSIKTLKIKIERWNIPSEAEIREKNRIARNNKKSEK